MTEIVIHRDIPPRVCGDCAVAEFNLFPKFHPESDVGPWDDACKQCGHLGGHEARCPVLEEGD